MIDKLYSKLKAFHLSGIYSEKASPEMRRWHFPDLVEIHLTDDSSIRDTDIFSLVTYSTHLTFVQFSKLDSITSMAMSHLGQHCTKLKHLKVEKCCHMNDVKYLKTACYSSQLLSFCATMSLTHSKEDAIATIAAHCPSLITLSGDFVSRPCDYDIYSWRATSDVISKLTDFSGSVVSDKMLTGWQSGNDVFSPLQLSVNMTKLSLFCSYDLTDIGMGIICDNCKLITELDVVFCDSLTKKLFIIIANELNFLKHIQYNVQDSRQHYLVLLILSERFQQLEHLDTFGSCQIQGMPITHKLPYKVSAVIYNAIFDKKESVSEIELKTLQYILPKCGKLSEIYWETRKLQIATVTEVMPTGDHDAGLMALAKHNTSVTTLCCLSESTITDTAFEAFCVHCPLLRNITFLGCKNLTDQALLTIAKHCRNLRELNFGSCTHIRNRAYGNQIVENCKLLDAYTRWYHDDSTARTLQCYSVRSCRSKSIDLLMQYK